MKNKFPERLKELRVQANLSQEKLSKNLNGQVTQVAIALWEQGKRVPNLDAVMLIAEYFGVSIDYLAGLED
ncbi:MAG: helix-turn-helix transcriptional regulator [Clostridiales bacterium]|nr:helix-turn-helix transcriptional regulator [Clostridiales bacterium]